MANSLVLSTAAVNQEADSLSDRLDGGVLWLYDSIKPATADTAIATQTCLATLALNATFSGAAVSGVLTANAITADSSANATGTATWFRMATASGVLIADGTAGTASTDLVLNTASIVSGASVSITSFIFTIPKS
jgi:hypothetical protein